MLKHYCFKESNKLNCMDNNTLIIKIEHPTNKKSIII